MVTDINIDICVQIVIYFSVIIEYLASTEDKEAFLFTIYLQVCQIMTGFINQSSIKLDNFLSFHITLVVIRHIIFENVEISVYHIHSQGSPIELWN